MTFRLQLHAGTRAKQLEIWERIMKERFSGYFISMNEPPFYRVFRNESIKRELDSQFALTVCEHLRERKLGEWQVANSKFLFYRFPIPDWGEKIHAWSVRIGKINSIESAYSIVHGDDSEEEFRDLPNEIFLHALKWLESAGKCDLVGEHGDISSLGVKFFP